MKILHVGNKTTDTNTLVTELAIRDGITNQGLIQKIFLFQKKMAV